MSGQIHMSMNFAFYVDGEVLTSSLSHMYFLYFSCALHQYRVQIVLLHKTLQCKHTPCFTHSITNISVILNVV